MQLLACKRLHLLIQRHCFKHTQTIKKPIQKMESIQVDPQRQQDIAHNLSEIQQRLHSAALSVGRQAQDVRLVAVSKTKPASDVLAAYQAGHRHFGENVQELVDKAKQLPLDIQWHFIGTLQSNKCKLIANIPNLFVVETLGSKKTAEILNKACSNRSSPLNVFLQINTSQEESKSGIEPHEAVDLASFISKECPHLKVAGLMTIGSATPQLEQGENPDFKRLIQCKHQIEESLAEFKGRLELSMGMSGDFELAAQSGSTNVRVGSSLFGQRNYTK